MDPAPRRPDEESRGLRGSAPWKDERSWPVGEWWQVQRSEVTNAHGEFLLRYFWWIFASLEVPADLALSPERARKIAHRWVQLWGPETSAYYAYETGQITGKGHIHLLLTGKCQGGTVHQIDGKWVWRYQGLDFPITGWSWAFGTTKVEVAHIELFHPKKGRGAEYVSAGVFDNPEYGDFIGEPQRHRRRKRGR